MRSSRFFSSWNCASGASAVVSAFRRTREWPGDSITPAAVRPAVAVFRKSRRFDVSLISSALREIANDDVAEAHVPLAARVELQGNRAVLAFRLRIGVVDHRDAVQPRDVVVSLDL